MDRTSDSEVQPTARERVQDREARLAQRRQRDRGTREQETAEQRGARLASQREHTRASRAHQRQESRHTQVDANISILSEVPLFDQASVHTRMLHFHCKLAAARETVQDREARLAQRRQRGTHMTCQTSFRIIHVIGTHTRYARPNDVYVTLVPCVGWRRHWCPCQHIDYIMST